ncbi:MAG: PSD1 domain-containing protein [Bryobacterales bacterium]|nr:PSD1 domain-containing protein [Bryobacterales bacterium]
MGGLRLDSLEAMTKGGSHGAALKPGDPDNSAIIARIKETKAELRMPMGGKLKPAQIADLEAWVKAGAPWPKTAQTAGKAPEASGKYTISPERRSFWSFQPLAEAKPPEVKDAKWAKNEIDRFVLAQLEREGIKPVRPATKRDLLRRATLDITGLPPTPEEITAFEKDTTAGAFEKVVDRLLASPHYGERWGRAWLDVARYGEDDYRSLNPNPRGYRPYPNAYMYRDWVIQAINDDLPYDQFVKAQLAGDLMDPKVRQKMLPATGFLGLGPWYYDNGSNEVTRADERHDRVDVVTRGFLGVTVGCARCHDHKYDPVPQSDYYALAGVFFNTVYEEYPRAPKKVVDSFTKLEADLDKKQKLLSETNQAFSGELSRSLVLQTSNYLQAVWEVTGRQKKEMDQVVEARKLDYELLSRWIKYMAKPTDKYKNKDAWQTLMKKGGGTLPEAKKLADQFQEEIVAVMLERNELEAENKVIADKDMEGTKPKKRTDKPSNFVSNRDFNPGSWLRLKSLPEDQNAFWTEIFQRELKDAEDPAAMMAAGGRMGAPGVLLFRGWGLESRIGAEAQARLKSVQADLEAVRKQLDPYYPFLHGVKDSPTPVNIQLALRGNPETLGPEVPRHFLSVFSDKDPEPYDKGSGRLQLAEQIVKQPISMRVIVNRLWKGHFGAGIVDTPSNFGFGGERPTNPELLEYLAQDFVKNGMSMKQMHRRIMLSSTYQLSTEMNQAAFDKDSGNRMYWRMTPRRMDAEQIRDSVLAVAGNLEDSSGGPSQELTPAFPGRTVYGKVSRYKLDAYLQLFDFPSPGISAEKRFTTTVPLQRLFLMNSDFVQMQAEALAKRVATEPDNRARIRKAYLLAYGREPKDNEIQLGLEYLRTEPVRAYEESKKKAAAEPPAGGARRRKADDASAPTPPEASGAAAAPETAAATIDAASGDATPPPAAADAGMGMGMMGGMGNMGGAGGGRRGPAVAPPVKYEATAWGRYAKILLSSSEFMFIN